jgi:hypothetical protein
MDPFPQECWNEKNTDFKHPQSVSIIIILRENSMYKNVGVSEFIITELSTAVIWGWRTWTS